MLGSETAETNLRMLLFPCYLQLLGVHVGERDCGDESADAAFTMLFAAVGGPCWGARRSCGRWWWRMLLCKYAEFKGSGFWTPYFGGAGEGDCGDESVDAAVTVLFAAVGGRCGGARLRRRICGRCCYHAICIYLQLLGVDVGERDCGEESADAAAGGCCCAIKGSRFWTPYFLHLNGCCCGRPCCGRCWVTMLLRNIVLRTMLV